MADDLITQNTTAERFFDYVQRVLKLRLQGEVYTYVNTWSQFWGIAAPTVPPPPGVSVGDVYGFTLTPPQRLDAMQGAAGDGVIEFNGMWKAFVEAAANRVVARVGGIGAIAADGDLAYLLPFVRGDAIVMPGTPPGYEFGMGDNGRPVLVVIPPPPPPPPPAPEPPDTESDSAPLESASAPLEAEPAPPLLALAPSPPT